MSTLFQDLRYAFRTLKHNPGFAIVAIVSLALGIGATSAIFSFASFMLLRPLPVPNASEIIIVQSQLRGESLGGGGLTDYSPLSYPDFDDLRKRSNSFAGFAASQYLQFGFASDKTVLPQMKFGALVNGSFFSVLGVRPELGRGFRDDEDKVPGRNAVVMLGHDLWKTEFVSNADVIGRVILLNGLPFTVIGVAPESFTGPNNAIRADLYVPLAMQPMLAGSMQNELEARDLRLLSVYGRLKPGVGVRQAAAEARLISQQLAQVYPKTNGTSSFVVWTYRMNQLTSVPITTMLCLFLMALAAMVLLIACANVMNLMLSRASGRSREIAVRLAMGAKRGRLIRQLLTESLVIAILGGVLGLVVAQSGADLFSQMRIPADVPLVMDVKLDRQVLLFTLAVSVAAAVLFGLAPALESTKPDLVSALKSTAGAESKRHRLVGRNALVIAQVAGSLLLLIAGTQAYRGASLLLSAPAGFRSTHILLASFNPTLARDSAEQTKQFYKQLLDQARVLPGVKSAALAQAVPYVPMPPGRRVARERTDTSQRREPLRDNLGRRIGRLWPIFRITLSGTLTTLYTFCASGEQPCADGSQPYAGLVQGSDGNFYGTTYDGGAYDYGTVFKITPSGTLTMLHSFCSQPNCNDGANPEAGLVQAIDGNFYGTALFGGTYSDGTVFKITPSGTLTMLHGFDYTDGAHPGGRLVQTSNGNFYGTTGAGGNYDDGTVFRLGVVHTCATCRP